MLKVNKKDEPQFFTEFKRKKSPKNWDELDKPVEENPEEYFSYSIRTGKIIPKKENGLEYEKAVKTIEILNLNENRLCEYRKTYILKIINTVGNLNDNNKIEIINYFDEFPTLKKFLIENIETLKNN